MRTLPATCVLGAYGHGVFGALQTLEAAEAQRCGGLRERLRIVRARRVLLATGATERLIAFPGNDVPGVMLAGAALAYLRRYGVAAGRRPALFANNDEAYESVFALAAAGIDCAGVIDPRTDSRAAARARALGIPVHAGTQVTAVAGRRGVRAVTIAPAGGGPRSALATDCLLISGGHTPASALASQLGAALEWQDAVAGFVPLLAPALGQVAGAARGVFGLAAAAADGERAARRLAAELGVPVTVAPLAVPPDPERSPPEPLWEVEAAGKAFVDLQNDVTAADVRLACREGYEHLEHMKRYTTHGMATDQGRSGGLVGAAVLARARGVALSAVGMLRPRPYAQPVPFAALAGAEVREHFKPRRRLPLHAWHEAAGATFVSTGLWLRPLVYSRQGGWEPVLEEARAVRSGVGLTDVSTLGKIDVQGPDAARFLDFIYANTFSTLAVGRARYGIMLREDGMLLDDGTTARLGPRAVPGHHHDRQCGRGARAHGVPPADGVPRARRRAHRRRRPVGAVRPRRTPRPRGRGAAWSPTWISATLPFRSWPRQRRASPGLPGRVFRISFSGELAYELAVPAQHAAGVWAALLEAGRVSGIRPYGLDALNTLRIEKGHVTTAELNGNTTADDLGMQRLLKARGDFVGRTLAQRPGLTAPERLQLVGVRPVDRSRRLRNGTQLVMPAAPDRSLGYITSCTPSTELGSWVGLALVSAGRRHLGERLIGLAPVHGESTDIEIISPHMLDPENTRVRA